MIPASAFVMRAAARGLSTLSSKSSCSLLLFDNHSHYGVQKLLADSIPDLIESFGIEHCLFEMPESLRVIGVRQALKKQDHEICGIFRELVVRKITPDLFFNLADYANENYGQKFSYKDLSNEDLSAIARILSLEDYHKIAKASLPLTATRLSIDEFAHSLYSVGKYDYRARVIETAEGKLGKDSCHYIDLDLQEKLAGEPEVLAARNINMVLDGVWKFPQALGFFGIAHYRDPRENGLMDIMTRMYKIQNGLGRKSDEALEQIRGRGIINPAEIVCIQTYEHDPRTSYDGLKETDTNILFPLYKIDVAGCDVVDFSKKLKEIKEAHQEKFSTMSTPKISALR